LAALSAQDYPNLEIIISDNASTDRTPDIALAAAAKDPRIRYSRRESNSGAPANFNRVLEDANGTYFMWASDHDLWESDFVSACVSALEERPDAVLSYPQTLLIDESGAPVEVMDDQIDLEQTTALARYKQLIWRLTICNMIYGVGRTAAMQATGGAPAIIGADHLVLAKLALNGPIVRVGGLRFLRRQNRAPETRDEFMARSLSTLHPAGAAIPDARENPYRALRDAHLMALNESSLGRVERLEGDFVTRACFYVRFGVRSPVIGLLVRVASILRLRRWARRRLGGARD
jgi:glycosyltransferase involved in cell wall biosynthesis